MLLSRLLPILFILCTVSAATWAGQITLKSTSSSFELTGELKDFNKETYTIETDLGILEVDARTVDCIGSSCPDISNRVSALTVSGNKDLIDRLLVPLTESYSFSLSAEIETAIVTDNQSNIKIIANGGQDLAKISIRSGAAFEALQNTFAIRSGLPEAINNNTESTQFIPIAADALIAITSNANSVSSISKEMLDKVLLGEITNWNLLGGPDANINLYLPKLGTDLANIAKSLGYGFTKPSGAKYFEDLEQLAQMAINDPYSLGLISFSERRSAKILPVVGKCAAFMDANIFNISSGNYPTTYYHYLEITPEPLPVFARDFIAFLGGQQVNNMLERQGYPSFSVHEKSMDNQGNRIAYNFLSNTTQEQATEFRSLLTALNGARQLSTVLRFSNGKKTKLKPQSIAAIDILLSELFLGKYADQTVLIVGFTDQKSNAIDNKKASLAMAKFVADYIKNADTDGLLSDLRTDVSGHGNISSLVCKNSYKHKEINSRVEIWVKDAI